MNGPRHFGAVMSAMVTPFDAQGRLDLDAAQRLARWLVAHGNDGLAVAATTGEAATLSDAERRDLVRAVCEAVTVPVLAGTGTNDTAHTIALTREARGLGAAGVLLVGPYYNRPPQAGIEAHFRAAAAATDLRVMIYDVPLRTGRRIAHEVLLRLFREVPNIVAFKDATGDPGAAALLVAEAGEHLDLYSGDDSLTLPLLAIGAVGVVGTSTHWTALQFTQLIAAFQAGRVERRQEPSTPGCSNPSPSSTATSRCFQCRSRPCCARWARRLGTAVCRCCRRPPMCASAPPESGSG